MRLIFNNIGHCYQSPVKIQMSSSFHPFSKSSATTFQKDNKTTLGKNWMEYHGSNNWDGLLDPLDDTLGAELLRYGKFVESTYNSFNFDPTSPSYASSLFPKDSLLPLSGLPDTGYTVTRNLHASSGIRLPSWADSASSTWTSNRTSWIGYVAVCDDEDEIARLGRRDLVVAFRGTTTCMEWLENLRATLTHIRAGADNDKGHDAMVQRGFWSLYSSAGVACHSLQQEIRDEVGRLLDTYGHGKVPLSITVTGHSLGAALALLSAYDVTTTFRRQRHPPQVTVISFGGPRVGNARFRQQVEELGIKVLRIVNTRDIVTKVPGYVVDGRSPCWLSRAGLAYSDVGQELRVSCSSGNMAACHDLSVYLQLLKQLRANCPFTGKKSGQKKGFQWPSLSSMPMTATRG